MNKIQLSENFEELWKSREGEWNESTNLSDKSCRADCESICDELQKERESMNIFDGVDDSVL
jgi:hypothetical protein